MRAKTEYPPRLVVAVLLAAASLVTTLVAFAPGITIAPVDMGDLLYLVFVMLHPAWAATLLAGGPYRPLDHGAQRRSAEMLFFFGLFLFLFAYIFASNANMDYVQRFVASGGDLQLAPDTRTERHIASARFVPLLVVDLAMWIAAVRADAREALLRERWPRTDSVPSAAVVRRALRTGSAPTLTILSVMLSVLAFPSFVHLEGFGVLGWVSLVPLFVVIRRQTETGHAGRAVGYGILYGVLLTLLGNYWLGTFNLISLQAVGIIFFGFYAIYMPIAAGLLRIVPRGPARAAVLPLSWTAFELARSSGFLGYPWLLNAHSQYRNLPLIQWAEFGGVWLVSLIVLVVNAALAEAILAILRVRDSRESRDFRESRDGDGSAASRRAVPTAAWRRPVTVALAVLVVAHAGGALLLLRPIPTRDTVRMALIQQNSDPRKHDYQRTLDSLMRLTDEALAANPDLVVWSETAFVPNIRRWSQEDPDRYQLARLVREFLAYQDSIDRWLLTGNDDYRRVLDADGNEVERNSYNAAVLFSDTSERRETYHKIRLVPFTEYFPYEEQLPWLHDMLMNFDIAFWTPGTERTIFHHPKVRFATPICFEDVFPQEVRRFAQAGMEVIVNITNDYWSLRETAAQQHFVAAMFRTVELRRPMVRATASGVTSHVDVRGRIVATVPQYSEQYLIADVAVPDLGPDDTGLRTLYLRWGDWVPRAAAGAVFLLAAAGVVERLRRRSTRRM